MSTKSIRKARVKIKTKKADLTTTKKKPLEHFETMDILLQGFNLAINRSNCNEPHAFLNAVEEVYRLYDLVRNNKVIDRVSKPDDDVSVSTSISIPAIGECLLAERRLHGSSAKSHGKLFSRSKNKNHKKDS